MGEATMEDAGAGGVSEPRPRREQGPVAFVVTLPVEPGREAEFLALLTPVLDAMRHEATFVNAILNRDPEDPARFMIYETWADLADLVEVQLKRPYREAYEAALPGLLRAPRAVETWQPLRADVAAAA